MNKPKLILGFQANGAIKSRRIIKFKDGNDAEVVQAAAKGDAMFGITSDLDVNGGEPVDVVLQGSASCEYGTNVEAGQLLTSDGEGRAVPAGNGDRTIGIAMQNGVVSDIGSVLINPSKI